MHYSAAEGDLSELQKAYSEQPELIEDQDEYGRTPLHRAAIECHEEAIDFLLSKGALINARDNWVSVPDSAFCSSDYPFLYSRIRHLNSDLSQNRCAS